ncbi:DNA cytosine methyltransferase [Streptomyces lydicus]|uniref:DNA cytosine methyltransferase n=1 Tax=Streptomyces lydicus TaxID=47763 RepID=UPI0037BA872D
MILDLFAGPSGWSRALGVLGAQDLGLEWDEWACKTRSAAGQLTIRTDVAMYPTWPFIGRTRGLIASPPCQAWSMAGKRLGLIDQPLVHQTVADLASGRDSREHLLTACRDERSLLAVEPMRYLHALNADGEPEWVAMEEIPDVLPLWRQ